MKRVILALAASGLSATLASAFPEGPPPRLEPAPPEELIARNAVELGIADDTVAQIRAIGEQQRSERDVIVAELRQQKLALRGLLEGANPSEAEAIALARKIGTLETDLSVSRLTAMMRMHALLTPEQNAALHEKMRGRFAERRERLDAATTACQAEIAAHCDESGAGPPGPPLMCVLHKRLTENLAVSEGCGAALREIPPPVFIRHRGPPHGGGEPFDVLVPPPPDAE